MAWSNEPVPAPPAGRAPRGRSMCRRVVEEGTPVVVEDVLQEAGEASARQLWVRHGLRFFAGAPLVRSDGQVVGAISLLDSRPREFGEKNVTTLLAFARAAAGRLEALHALERERAARRSEREYRRNIFELANDAIMILDPETGRVLDANDRAAAMYRLDDRRPADFAALFVDPEREAEHFREVAREGSCRGFGSTHRRGDGTSMEVEINSSAVSYKGRPAVLSILRDVTEARHLERALRKSEARFRSLVQNASDLITLIDRTGTVVFVSPAIRSILGYEPEERVGAHVFDLVHPDDVAHASSALSEGTREPGSTLVLEVRALHRGGGWRHLEMVVTNLLEDPAVGAIVLNSRDVTRRKRAEDALKEGERRHAHLLSNMPALVHRGLHGPGRAGIFCSDYAEELTGHAPAEFFGGDVTLEDIIVEGDRARVRDGVRAALEGRRRYNIEYTIRHKDGSVRHVEERGGAVRDPEAGTTAEGVIYDVTGLRRAVQGLREAELRYRTLVEQIPTVTYIEEYGGTKSLMYLSPQYEDLLGYSTEEAIRNPDHWLNTLHPEDRERVATEDLRTDEMGEPFEMEYRQIARDGRVVWIHDKAQLVRDGEGRPLFWQGVLADITERRLFLERLKHMALHDPLTNLPNRYLFTERLEQALERSGREGRRIAVLMVDLDDFKRVNDSFGHEAGDRVLTAVADRLRACLRPADTVSRLGGDEFVVLLEDVREGADAIKTAERIGQQLREPVRLKGRTVVVTPSIGVTFGGPGTTPRGPDDLLRDADLGLYEAKERGKSRHIVSLPRSGSAPVRSDELSEAIRHGELVLHYQPLVSLGSGDVVGTEALVRWRHPSHGLLSPSEFVPMAEEGGLISALGRWVIGAACRQGGEWQRRYRSIQPAMSVNLSAGQLKDPGLVEWVERALDAAALPPGNLILEITESVSMDDAPATMSTLRRLNGLGVRLAMDDFGSGYSSLSYLKRFPMDLIKIDRSIVTGLDRDPGDRAIVSATITMAHALGLLAVAEGVNTEAEAAGLRELGCDMGQGAYWWAPREAALVEELLATQAG